MHDALHKLTSSSLRQLAASLRDGELAGGITTHAARQIAGGALAEDLVNALTQLRQGGWAPSQIAELAEAIVESRERVSQPEELFDLVLSGPDVPGVPTRDTAAVMHALIEEARQEVILVGYAVYNGKKLFERLAERARETPGLDLWFCLNVQRPYKDTSLSSEIVRRFAMAFAEKDWPWRPLPQVYYDPRSLDQGGSMQSSLHAKCLVIDRKAALITSANFTEAAHKRNIEAGVVVRYEPLVIRIASYFDALRRTQLEPMRFPEDKP